MKPEGDARSREARVAVCVITYNRPEGLRRLLEGLDRLTFAGDPPPAVEIVLVDNDPAGLACAPYESRDGSSTGRWPLRCYVEPRRGIPYARNRSVAGVEEGVDFVAFVDDDEVPEPGWLDELLHVQQLYDADVVAGPVVRHFDEPVPAWVAKGKFFEKRRYPTGHPVKFVDTANALVRNDILGRMDKHFDERMALNGGDDTHLFLRIHRAGYRMVWADGAIVHELIPKSRANTGWLLRRAYRLGNSLTLCEIDLYPSFSVRVVRVAKAAGRIARGLLLVPVSPLLGWHAFVRAVQDISRGAGMLAGLAGVVYEEYRRTHGM